MQQPFEGLLKTTKESVSAIASMTSNDNEEMEKAFKFFEPKMLQENLQQLEELMLDIALKIDKKTLRATKKRFEPIKSETDLNELRQMIERLFDGAPIPQLKS